MISRRHVAGLVAVATSLAGCAAPEAATSDTVAFGLVETCMDTRATDQHYVVSPGLVALEQNGPSTVRVVADVEGASGGYVGTAVATAGILAGDAGVLLDDTMELTPLPAELDGPQTWPLVIIARRDAPMTATIEAADGSTFTLKVSDDC